MKLLPALALLPLAIALQAQPTCTQITGPFYADSLSGQVLMPTGSTIQLALNYTSASNGVPVGPSALRATITSGAINAPTNYVCLTPGNWTASYTVNQALPAIPPFSRTWIVPAGGPYVRAQVETTSPPVPPVVPVPPSQISSGGATSGQCLAWNGAAWAPATCGTGGGATIPATTNLISGDGAGNGANSNIAPSSVVLLTATQSLTNKTLDGIGPTIMGYLANISSDVQAQLNAKQAALGFTPLNAASNLSDVGSASAAKTNLGLATVATSGSYTDLSSKPAIPTVTGGTCTSQVVTVISTSAVPTCSTITSAYADASIAKTGADINTRVHRVQIEVRFATSSQRFASFGILFIDNADREKVGWLR